MRRRDFLNAGIVSGLSIGLNEIFGQKVYGDTSDAKAQAVINIYLPGGMAAQESFDPKPQSPLEYRGPFGVVNTPIPGVKFSELFKDTAKIADKISTIRSMTHGESAHERGRHNMMTGYRPSPALKYPSMGSVVANRLGSKTEMPPYIWAQGRPGAEESGSGFLSPQYNPFSLGSNPESNNFKVRDLVLPDGTTPQEFMKRLRLLEITDSDFKKKFGKDPNVVAMDKFYKQAFKMLASPKVKDAFDLSKEKATTKKKYGASSAGQRMLMARRLVESGVRFVSLSTGSWDHHNNIKNSMERNAPPLDKAFAALINDLEERGMLESTLVMITTEFGRTPKINTNSGRDHWPKVYSMLMAGGGIKQGYVHGSSDQTWTAPDEDPLTVSDWAMTVYDLMGINGKDQMIAPGNRPVNLVDAGKVVKKLLA